MAPTTHDLRLALREAAGATPAPAPADVLAGLRAERSRRRRRALLGAVSGAAAAAVVGVALLQLVERPHPGPAQDGSPSTAAAPWALVDGEAPPQADGLVRLSSAPVDYADPGRIALPDAESLPSDQRWAVLWCDVGPDDAAITPPSLRLTTGAGDAVEVPCLPRDGSAGGSGPTPVALPPGEGLSVVGTWSGDVPARGEAVLAVYQEASRSDYDFPGWPEPPLEPPVHEEATIIGPDSAGGPVGGSSYDGARTVTVELTSDTSLALWRGVPGGLQVEVDGVLVTDDGDLEDGSADGAWQHADPELREGVWEAFRAGQTRSLALPDEVLPEPGRTRSATVTVVPRGGDQHWQVAVLATADGAPSALAPTDTGTELPEWYAGLHRIATWQVPADGSAVPLRLPRGLAGQDVSWAVVCPSATGGPASQDPPSGSVPTAALTVDGRRSELTCATPERGLDVALLNLETRRLSGTVLAADPTVTAALESSPGASGTVAAYVAVPFEEFDFASATPPVEVDTESAIQGEVSVQQTVGTDDLGPDGTVEMELSARTTALRLTTEGVGRVRLMVDGEPVDGLEDGWWTSWTDQRVTVTPPALLHRLARPGTVLHLQVEGYESGELRAELLSVQR